MSRPSISRLSLQPSGANLVRAGLLGWISLVVDNVIRIDGIALRRTADGRLVLSWPARRDRKGGSHALVRPVDDEARLELERVIFGELRFEEGER